MQLALVVELRQPGCLRGRFRLLAVQNDQVLVRGRKRSESLELQIQRASSGVAVGGQRRALETAQG